MNRPVKRKKAGRPAKVITREVRAAVRFTRAEYFVVQQNAGKAGITISLYLRQSALQATVKTRLNAEERQFVRQLIGMANNLNQVAKTCHKEGALSAVVHFETYRNQLDHILQKLEQP